MEEHTRHGLMTRCLQLFDEAQALVSNFDLEQDNANPSILDRDVEVKKSLIHDPIPLIPSLSQPHPIDTSFSGGIMSSGTQEPDPMVIYSVASSLPSSIASRTLSPTRYYQGPTYLYNNMLYPLTTLSTVRLPPFSSSIPIMGRRSTLKHGASGNRVRFAVKSPYAI